MKDASLPVGKYRSALSRFRLWLEEGISFNDARSVRYSSVQSSCSYSKGKRDGFVDALGVLDSMLRDEAILFYDVRFPARGERHRRSARYHASVAKRRPDGRIDVTYQGMTRDAFRQVDAAINETATEVHTVIPWEK